MTTLSETILGALSSERRVTNGDDGPDPNPLWQFEREYPDFGKLVSGKRVLDFGCGFGHQSAMLKARYGCDVTGLDTDLERLRKAREWYPDVRFIPTVPYSEKFDVIVSQDSMEHFTEPCTVLHQMRHMLTPGGRLLITFAPPWYAPYGSHTRYFCRVPWIHVLFSERTIMAVRARYRSDGATRFAEVHGGLNQMSLAKFRRLLRDARFEILRLEYRGLKGQDWLTWIPGIREFFTMQVTVQLTPKLPTVGCL